MAQALKSSAKAGKQAGNNDPRLQKPKILKDWEYRRVL